MNEDSGTCVILGATGGIGAALAERLVADGRSLLLAARGEEALEALGARLDQPWRVCEATDAAAVDELFDEAAGLPGGVTGAACCVGSILLKPAHSTSPEEWSQTLRLNLDTAFHVVRSGAKQMLRGGGSIALVASAAARVGLSNHEAIAAAKAGVIGLGRSAAATYAPRGIRVNVIAPGLVDTPLAARLVANAASLEASRAMHPLGRIGNAQDVASALAWVLDPNQSWVTGQVIGVDGGLGDLRPRG
ncbi:SDR family NAD(P)-dependent oxidoreductase [Engelhardtia mirabilis]|uniref:2,5-dichloro-2,5-cyclohexadiene-1,4-diol dehydrogenase n=1 Tax=Engelhardtia mirabilis TaxID=2528011 RepID=A0A518BQ78_9BACT|nr:2,5-dichloro-2,5-cyclohexadiene-1,4-diol dehydrogenase [Planctomycetes bacterium Pla133]QDV03451.1 2,5-dichloro-2,5-cyclohexadiene-1,4-diol dehydrogenase [Planctomycetes bacterium Pla86]